MSLRLPLLLAGVTLATSFLADGARPAAAQPASQPQIASPFALTSSRSCDGLRDLMVDTLVYQMVQGGYYNPYYQQPYYGGGVRRPAPRPMPRSSAKSGSRAPTAAPAAPTTAAPMMDIDAGGARAQEAAPPPAGPSHYTKTNTQERGVDEADIVKTDGKHVYTLHNNELVIAKTWPVTQTDVAARMTFKTIQPQQLYLRGDEVIVQGQATEQLTGWNQGRTRVMVVDIRDRREPRIKKIIDVEGYSTQSRMVGDDVYLVQQSSVVMPPHLTQLAQQTMANVPRADGQTLRPWEVQSRLANTLRRTLLAKLTTREIESALPRVRAGGVTQQMRCEDLYVPPGNAQLQVTSLARVSVTGPRADLTGAMVTGGQVYASTNALYVSAPFYSHNANGYAEYATQVHQFSLGDRFSKPTYVASGKVEGQILNSFSMSEHQGDLRIATTDWNWRGEQGGNNLFVLRPFGRRLETIGALRGLAKGERIYAGRMIGDKGYLVTFRQTDPLFTLDLRDPTRPRVAGELKVNGFSNYIHPIGGDLLLTIGQDADANGRQTGLHLQVFDVSNPARPTRRFHEKVSSTYSNSTAQHDHHAFMFDPVTGTLAFPMYENVGNEWFNGLAVYTLDRKRGFRAKGRLDHGALAEVFVERQCETMRTQNPQYAQHYCSDQYRRQGRAQYPVTRSLIVDKFILSFSNMGMEIHELADLDVAATLSWEKVQKASPRIAQ